MAVASIPSGVVTAPTAGVDRRQEVGGGSIELEVGRERGERAKRGRGGGQRLSSVRQVAGEGDGEGSGVASAWKREMEGERGALPRRLAAGTGPWPTGASGRCTCAWHGTEQGRRGR
jgi:hypothetical protein